MKEPKPSFALVIHACDRYLFLFKGFEFFFNKYWDDRINCKKYFATEEIEVEIPGFTNIRSGKGEWSNRLRKILLEIEEEYIIYMQEDMWFAQQVDADSMNNVLAFSLEHKILQFKLHSSEVYKTNPIDQVISGLRVSKIDNAKSNFLMSHQITIWNKDFLKAQLPKGEHPWRNERKGTKRLKKIDYTIYHLDMFAENGKPAINANLQEEKRSKYFTVSVNGTFSENILSLLDEISQSGDPAIKEYGQQIKFNFENNITHDGLSKPRKEDFFKKLRLAFKFKK